MDVINLSLDGILEKIEQQRIIDHMLSNMQENKPHNCKYELKEKWMKPRIRYSDGTTGIANNFIPRKYLKCAECGDVKIIDEPQEYYRLRGKSR